MPILGGKAQAALNGGPVDPSDLLKSAGVAAANVYAFGAIGTHYNFAEAPVTNVVLHGVVGGVSSVVVGGQFKAGFAGGAAGAFVTPLASGAHNSVSAATGSGTAGRAAGMMVSAIAGGTAASIAGGKFANGAVTGAFGYAFNEAMHPRQRPNYGITDEQRAFAAGGDAEGFWNSRLAVGDPMAGIGLSSLHPSGGLIDYLFGGTSINNRLQAFARVYAGGELDINQVRVDLMRAHLAAVDADVLGTAHLLNPRQIAVYHHQVFSTYSLPTTAFGGTPMTGALWEASATRWVWCHGCD